MGKASLACRSKLTFYRPLAGVLIIKSTGLITPAIAVISSLEGLII